MNGLPHALAANPRLDRWLAPQPDGTLLVRTGKVELGQGVLTAMALVAASELRVPLAAIRVAPADTRVSPDEGYTAGSLSIELGAPALRVACAMARELFVEAAARALGAEPAEIVLAEGVFRRGGANEGLGYADLAGAVDLAVSALDRPAPALLGLDDEDGGAARLDLPPKLSGAAYVQDLREEGMLFGRVLRPAHPAERLAEIDADAVAALPGVVAAARDGAFFGVVATSDEAAAAAIERARRLARFERRAELPPCDEAQSWMDALPARSRIVVEDEPAAGAAALRLEATFARPYLLHASIGPSCAVARWEGGRLLVRTHSQGVYPLRAQLARALRIPQDAIDVVHAAGAGCYGHNGADDVALDAALLARAVDRPVMALWSRADELSWSPHGAAMRVRLAAGLAGDGTILDWTHEVWSPPHIARPGSGEGVDLLAAADLADPHPRSEGTGSAGRDRGGDRNAVPLYRVGARRIVHHELPQGPLRSSALRSLGAHANVFAIESFLDELAAAAGEDPLAFRLRRCADPRLAAVLEAAAEAAGWDPAEPGGEGIGRGIAGARYKNSGAYYAAVVRVEVEAGVRVASVHGAVDAGRVVHRDGILNQVEGGVVQAVSWTLKEEARWTPEGFAVRSWADYPILPFSQTPRVETRVLPSREPSLGAGECAAGPIAAAIGNAVAHALGVRVRRMPITPERIVAAIEAA